MRLKPITLREANAYVEKYHRHHKPSRGHKFSIGCVDNEERLLGIVIIGRPVSRCLDDGYTAEVTRLCTDGIKNVCSMLYSAAWRACKAMGYRQVYTYILESESGTSLKASNWICDGVLRKNGIGWSNRKGRGENHPQAKIRWMKK